MRRPAVPTLPASSVISRRLGDADPRYANEPLSEEELKTLSGDYKVEGDELVLRIGKNSRGDFSISAPDVMIDRSLFHQGGNVFNPAGAEAVKIRFQLEAAKATSLVVEHGESLVRALVRRPELSLVVGPSFSSGILKSRAGV